MSLYNLLRILGMPPFYPLIVQHRLRRFIVSVWVDHARVKQLITVTAQPLSPPLNQVMSPSEGSESDDELSIRAGSLSRKMPEDDNSRPTSHDGPLRPPLIVPQTLSRTQGPQFSLDDGDSSTPYVESQTLSSTASVLPMN